MGRKSISIAIPFLFTLCSASLIHAQWQHTFWQSGTIACGSIGNKMFVNSYSGLLRSTDNGYTWVVTDLGNDTIRADSILNSINTFATNGNNFYAGTDYGLYVSNDSGISWKNLSVDGPKAIVSIFAGKTTLLVGTLGGYVFQSSNNGKDWHYSGTYGTYVRNFASVDNVIFIGTSDSGVFRSIDGGINWKNIISGSMGQSYSEWYVGAIGNIILATATGSETAFISNDGGDSWNPLRIPTPNDYAGPTITSLSIVGSNIFAGYTDAIGGVTLSSDTGKTWSIIGSMQRVNSLFVFDNYIFAGTNSAGLYRASISDFGIDAVNLEKAQTNFLSVTPNPATNNFTLNFPLNTEAEFLEIFDALGRRVMAETIPAGTTSYRADVSRLAAGVYLARIGEKAVRFVKQ
jgi:photosystem II stability/assembly factor-like uncharacterized protein